MKKFDGADYTLHEVVIRFGSHLAVDRVSMVLNPGVTFLLGRNGAGKTSLCRAIGGDELSWSGNAYIGEYGVLDKASHREYLRRVGWMPQDLKCPSSMRVRELVEYAAWLKDIPRSLVKSSSSTAIETADLTAKANAEVGSLSGGMKRRLALAAAIVHAPHVLILDEPTAGLDPHQRDSFHDTIRNLESEGRTTTLISTHILEDVAAIGGRIEVLEQGRLITDRFERPNSSRDDSESLRRAFLKAIEAGQ